MLWIDVNALTTCNLTTTPNLLVNKSLVQSEVLVFVQYQNFQAESWMMRLNFQIWDDNTQIFL